VRVQGNNKNNSREYANIIRELAAYKKK